MGTYTANQDFYKPTPDEFVDVETQLNYNLRRADEKVRALVEWQYTEALTGFPKLPGYKYFKAATNSFWVQNPGGSFWQHSGNGSTLAWSNSGLTIMNSYQSVDLEAQRVGYRLDSIANTVSWRGSMKLNTGFDEIPLNTNVIILNIPTSVRPLRNKYFFTHGGTSSTGFSVIRLLFKTDGDVEINRMGMTQTVTTERYISFNDVEYTINDA